MEGAQEQVAARLQALGEAELADVVTFVGQQADWSCGALLIEACRALDNMQVMQNLGRPPGKYIPVADFDLITRGWNILLSLLLPRVGRFSGIPAAPSTEQTRHIVLNLMHACGRYVMLTDTAERIRHGMVEGSVLGDDIELSLSEAVQADFFHDQVDRARVLDLKMKFVASEPTTDSDISPALRAEMRTHVFPWKLPKGTMVGYTSSRDVDSAFLKFFSDTVLEWRADAGIHPDAKLGTCTGADMVTTAHMLLSRYLAHIVYVEEARKIFPDVNFAMSLCIWKTRPELITELVILGAPEQVAAAVVDLVTVRAGDAPFFFNEHTPSFPMLIEIAEGYLLMPISAIFRNPLKHIRALRESTKPTLLNAVQFHHEVWMADDLCALFQGDRYQCVSTQTKLRSGGRVMTDVDAAILDYITGEIVLFQLKWQDFDSSNLKKQRSKAKNFVDKVEAWGAAVSEWIDEHGAERLCQVLKLKLPNGKLPLTIRLWGLGRSNARFRSLGYAPGSTVLALTWPQLVRLRHEIGPGAAVFAELARRVEEEAGQPVRRTPIPYTMTSRGQRIFIRDLWNSFDDDTDAPPTVDTEPEVNNAGS
ncbi:MAG: hypothetical protein ACK4MY_02185 [Brevundimonas sp.]